ncbi:prostatic acid phosphatase-like [Pollicipes pollicipes]|uniref:prostatic acid phosphatase-like n=1 Tax=Pollicipes pollicipes TaxID=41117 RepID=UPI001884EC34|nr:prostatic acid phosphatase-like [Pollicipes pollicipes]XP_037071528.1 prostatic acid phosphatase-like [Pollicipes pollicipes]
MNWLGIYIGLVTLICTSEAANHTLQLLQVLFRHGARTPIDMYPNDPNAGHWWQGPGQLTNEGKNNQYELGRFLRQRYADFLHPLYHMNYTRVESSDVDRTLMSAEANLAGLYPPQGRDRWNPDLPWQPIPVHTRPAEIDFKLRFLDSCQRYREARAALASSADVRALDAEYGPLYRYLQQHSGVPVPSLQQVSWLYDTFWIDDHHGLPIPEWARRRLAPYNRTVYPELMRPLSDISFQLMSHTQLMRRLGGGALLAEMVEHMRDRVAGTLQPTGRQLFMYSAHDFNVAALLAALGVYNGVAPPLASCVMVELHRDPTGAFFVQVFYRNDTTVEPYSLRLPGCTMQCPWEAFRDLTRPVRPADVAAECASAPHPAPSSAALIGESIALGLILMAFLVAGVLFCRSRRREDIRYTALDTGN